MFRLLILLSLASISMAAFSYADKTTKGDAESATFYDSHLVPFNGYTISKIEIHGLKYTKLRAVRWLLTQTEGDVFNSENWLVGIHKLYNTRVLYDIRTEPLDEGNHQVALHLHFKDKWTVFPYMNLQGGGGMFNIGGGVFDTNLFGHFTYFSAGASFLNSYMSYQFTLLQEFFFDTDHMFGIDATKSATPLHVENEKGEFTQEFVFVRTQEQLLIGKRLANYTIRAQTLFETYHDTLIMQSAKTSTFVVPGRQYRIRPQVIFGRADSSNFLETGSELRIGAQAANFLSSVDRQYFGATLIYKDTRIVNKNDNIAYFIQGGVLSTAPYPYQYRLGGFDTVRGFRTNRALGSVYSNINFEYRPLLISHRFSFLDLDLAALQGCVFVDGGVIGSPVSSDGLGRTTRPLTLVSGGLGIRAIFVRFANAIMRIDAARTLAPFEGFGYAFGIGQFF